MNTSELSVPTFLGYLLDGPFLFGLEPGRLKASLLSNASNLRKALRKRLLRRLFKSVVCVIDFLFSG